jgi:hypothetical protein
MPRAEEDKTKISKVKFGPKGTPYREGGSARQLDIPTPRMDWVEN